MEQQLYHYLLNDSCIFIGWRKKRRGWEGGRRKRDAKKERRRRGKCVGIANQEWRHLRRIINLRVCEVRR